VIAKDIISGILPPLRCSDSGKKALDIMESFRVLHLPLLKDSEYVGLISDKNVYDFELDDCCIGSKGLTLTRPYVLENQHIYEVAQMIFDLDLTVMPVLDLEHNYLGAITLVDLAHHLSKLVSVGEPGAVIVLDLLPTNYSLSQIAQIIESNDAKVLSLYVVHRNDSSEMDVTLKVNVTDVSSIVQTFARYDYTIKAVYMDDSLINDMYNDRFGQFMKYLSI
jgi:acetoin utilization protein AcuB